MDATAFGGQLAVLFFFVREGESERERGVICGFKPLNARERSTEERNVPWHPSTCKENNEKKGNS